MRKPGPGASILRKIWWFIWYDESFLSWLVNVAFAFVIIKFIVYPGLGMLLGTSYPVVAVVSGSMEHDGEFEDWWNERCAPDFTQRDVYEEHNIAKERFMEFPWKNGFNTGDIMVLYSPAEITLGEVVVFPAPNQPDPIIHRIVRIDSLEKKRFYTTKGDHNCGSSGIEIRIPEDRLLGKAIFRIPYLGWIKIIFVRILGIIGVM